MVVAAKVRHAPEQDFVSSREMRVYNTRNGNENAHEVE